MATLTGKPCYDDVMFHRLLDNELMGCPRLSDFSILILDECQDMRGSFFALISHLVTNVCRLPTHLKLLILGDPNQLLYDFQVGNSADVRFLTMAHSLFASLRPWTTIYLQTSYRLHSSCCRFLNHLTPDHTPIIPAKLGGSPVELYCTDLTGDMPTHALTLIEKAKKANIAYSDMLILTASCNSYSSAIPLVRRLVSSNIPVHVTRSGDLSEKVDKHHTQGKVRVSTYHAAKGLEAKLVIVLTRTLFVRDFPRPLYVALTRATERLVVYVDHHAVYEDDLKKLVSGKFADELQVEVRANPAGTSRPTEKTRAYGGLKTHYDAGDLFAFGEATLHLTLLEMVTTEEIQEAVQGNDDFESLTTIADATGLLSVAPIVMMAYTMAVEYVLRSTKPGPFYLSKLNKIKDKIQNDHQLRGPLLAATNTLKLPWTGVREVAVLDRIKAIAMVASVVDGFTAFADRMHSLGNFEFMTSITLFPALYHNCLHVLGIREGKFDSDVVTSLTQDGEEQIRLARLSLAFDMDCSCKIQVLDTDSGKNKTVTIHAKADIVVTGGGPVLIFSYDMVITVETKLRAAATAIVMGRDYVYIVNVRTGEVVRVSGGENFLVLSTEQKATRAHTLSDSEFVEEYQVKFI
jgi:hypothetical protein